MIKRVEIFSRLEAQKEKVYAFQKGSTGLVQDIFDNPSSWRGGLVVVYSNGKVVSISQHKGDTIITCEKKEWVFHFTQFIDVTVLGDNLSKFICDPCSDETPLGIRSLNTAMDKIDVILRVAKEESDITYATLSLRDKDFIHKMKEFFSNHSEYTR